MAGKPGATQGSQRVKKIIGSKIIYRRAAKWRGPRAQLVTQSVLPFLLVHVFSGYVASLSKTLIKTTTFKERS